MKLTDEEIMKMWFDIKHPIAFAYAIAKRQIDIDAEIIRSQDVDPAFKHRMAGAIEAQA